MPIIKHYPTTYETAFQLFCDAMSILGCKTKDEYIEKRKGTSFPTYDFFRNKFSIKIYEVIKIVYPERAKYELIYPTKKDLMKEVYRFFKETDYTLSIVNFDAWYERDLSKFIMKTFNMSWKEFKVYTLSIFPIFEDRIINNSLGRRIM